MTRKNGHPQGGRKGREGTTAVLMNSTEARVAFRRRVRLPGFRNGATKSDTKKLKQWRRVSGCELPDSPSMHRCLKTACFQWMFPMCREITTFWMGILLNQLSGVSTFSTHVP